MSSLFRIGQTLKGRLGNYTITKEVQNNTVWFARQAEPRAKGYSPKFFRLTPTRNQFRETVVIKSVEGHWRVENERDVLPRFRHRTPYLRPLVDEIEEPSSPVTIALRHLQSDLYDVNRWKPLDRREIKHVSRCVLEALQVLHEDGYVHTGRCSCYGYVDAKLNIILDVKPNNIFVNLQEGDMRFSKV
jgi:serine/threonine protein kinase